MTLQGAGDAVITIRPGLREYRDLHADTGQRRNSGLRAGFARLRCLTGFVRRQTLEWCPGFGASAGLQGPRQSDFMMSDHKMTVDSR